VTNILLNDKNISDCLFVRRHVRRVRYQCY